MTRSHAEIVGHGNIVLKPVYSRVNGVQEHERLVGSESMFSVMNLEDVTMLKKKLSKTPGYTVLPNDISSHL